MDVAFQKIDPPLPVWSGGLVKASSNSSAFWNLLLVAVATGIAVKALLPSWAHIFLQGVTLGSISGLTALLAALAASIILHESGHLAAAWLMNFEILGGSLGPVRASRLHGKWAAQFSGKVFSGSVSAIPRSNESWRARMLVVVAGGPAATFLVGILSASLLLLNQRAGWFNSFFAALTEFSFLLFVLGLIPNGEKAQVGNDARLFSSLRRNTPEAQEILLFHLVAQLSLAGMRPRDYPERLIGKLASARWRPDASALYAYTIALWAIDRGDLVTADAWDRRMVELSDSCDVRLRNLTLARSACFDLAFRDDIAAARNKFSDVGRGMLSPVWFMHRARAARWLAIGDVPETLAEVCRAQYAFPKWLPYFDFEKMLLSRIYQKALAVRPKSLSA